MSDVLSFQQSIHKINDMFIPDHACILKLLLDNFKLYDDMEKVQRNMDHRRKLGIILL